MSNLCSIFNRDSNSSKSTEARQSGVSQNGIFVSIFVLLTSFRHFDCSVMILNKILI